VQQVPPPALAAQGGQPEHPDPHQRERQGEDVREVAEPEQQVDLDRHAQAGALAASPPVAEGDLEEGDADGEVVEAELEELVEGEREGQEGEPPLSRPHRAGEVPGAAQEEQHVAAHQQLLRGQRGDDVHEERHHRLTDPVRIGLGADLVVLLEQGVALHVPVLVEDPGVVGVAGAVHRGKVAHHPEGEHPEQGEGEEERAQAAVLPCGFGRGVHCRSRRRREDI
jgi:hypothetical protein